MEGKKEKERKKEGKETGRPRNEGERNRKKRTLAQGGAYSPVALTNYVTFSKLYDYSKPVRVSLE